MTKAANVPPLVAAKPNQIDDIHAHLKAGGQIAVVTYGRTLKLTKRHVDYIQADGAGYRLGWPGAKSVFAFAYSVRFVPHGFRI
jgi:hypothetical protein